MKRFDPERPALSVLAVEADVPTLVAQVHANDGAKVVKKPSGKLARLCSWFAS